MLVKSVRGLKISYKKNLDEVPTWYKIILKVNE